MRSISKFQKLFCNICDKLLESNKILMQHKRNHFLASNVSDVENSSTVELKISGSYDKDKPYSCKECGSTFSQSGHLSIHIRTHTGEKPYTCDICCMHFKQISHLKTHVRTHTQDKPYQCDRCPSAFTQNSSLKRHKRAHTGEKPHKCHLCTMTFVVKSNMQRHLNTHTGEKPFRCDVCSSSFGQAIDLKRHKISHTGIKPHKCDLCEAAFSRKNNLKWHKLTHSDIAGYECSICYVGFSSPSDLKAHMRNHAPPKPFICDICPSSFRLLGSLIRHKMIHTGERPLRNKSGKTPVVKVVKRKPYSCAVCAATFCEKRNLKRHTLSIHPDFISSSLTKMDVNNTTINNCFDFSRITESNLTQTALNLQDPKSESEQSYNGTSVVSSDQFNRSSHLQTQDGLSGVQQIFLTSPGQNPRPARPAGLCQNHDKHFLTMMEGSINHWQSWCFCDPQLIPGQTSQVPVLVPANTTDIHNGITEIMMSAAIQPAISENNGQLIMTVSSPQIGHPVLFNSVSHQEQLTFSTQNIDVQSDHIPSSAQFNSISVKVESPSCM